MHGGGASNVYLIYHYTEEKNVAMCICVFCLTRPHVIFPKYCICLCQLYGRPVQKKYPALFKEYLAPVNLVFSCDWKGVLEVHLNKIDLTGHNRSFFFDYNKQVCELYNIKPCNNYCVLCKCGELGLNDETARMSDFVY